MKERLCFKNAMLDFNITHQIRLILAGTEKIWDWILCDLLEKRKKKRKEKLVISVSENILLQMNRMGFNFKHL